MKNSLYEPRVGQLSLGQVPLSAAPRFQRATPSLPQLRRTTDVPFAVERRLRLAQAGVIFGPAVVTRRGGVQIWSAPTGETRPNTNIPLKERLYRLPQGTPVTLRPNDRLVEAVVHGGGFGAAFGSYLVRWNVTRTPLEERFRASGIPTVGEGWADAYAPEGGRQFEARASGTRIGQEPAHSALTIGTRLICTSPFGCSLWSYNRRAQWSPLGWVPENAQLEVAPPWPSPATSVVGPWVLTRAMTPVGTREGWVLIGQTARLPDSQTARWAPRVPVAQRSAILQRPAGLGLTSVLGL